MITTLQAKKVEINKLVEDDGTYTIFIHYLGIDSKADPDIVIKGVEILQGDAVSIVDI
jgi:hypothetical protein